MNRQHKTIKTNYNHLMILLKHRDSGLVESKGGVVKVVSKWMLRKSRGWSRV